MLGRTIDAPACQPHTPSGIERRCTCARRTETVCLIPQWTRSCQCVTYRHQARCALHVGAASTRALTYSSSRIVRATRSTEVQPDITEHWSPPASSRPHGGMCGDNKRQGTGAARPPVTHLESAPPARFSPFRYATSRPKTAYGAATTHPMLSARGAIQGALEAVARFIARQNHANLRALKPGGMRCGRS